MADARHRDRGTKDEAKLQKALALHANGERARATRLYRQLIDRDPANAHALHFLGVIEAESGRLVEARELMARSLEAQPTVPQYVENYATILLQAGDLAAARAACEQGLAVGASPQLLYVNAVVLFKLRRFPDALSPLDRLLASQPNRADAVRLRACVLAEMRHYEQALAWFDRALRLDAALVEAWCGRGGALQALGRYGEARACYDRAIALDPGHAVSWLGRGDLLAALNRHAEACAAYDRSLAGDSTLVAAWSGRARALGMLKRHSEALACLDQALTLDPDNATAWMERGTTLYELDRCEDALAAWSKAAALDTATDGPGAQELCCWARLRLSDWSSFDADRAHLIAAVRDGRALLPWHFLVVGPSAEDQLQCARQWIAHSVPAGERPVRARRRGDHDRIRVAYLSSDFRDHPVATLTAGLFESHDRAAFEVTGLAGGPPDTSDIRARLARTFERFVDVGSRGDDEVAALISELEIDILVDLNGFTDNRIGVFAQRPAPIQVSYLGYAGTMGADYYDYLVADQILVPVQQQTWYSEKIVYLPDCFMANDDRRTISDIAFTRAEMDLPERGFVFCCFNHNCKITPAMFDIWMRLLTRVEGSVLWLRQCSSVAMTNLRREAAARGVSVDRLVFSHRLPSHADHLARCCLADLFLDTLPYNAHSTASDALWAGLPILTLIGDALAGRVAASLLTAVGLPELIATTPEDYEARAVDLATSPDRLLAIRNRLARNRLTTPLFDTARFARHLEAAFRTMHERHRAGLPPDHIRVDGSGGASSTARAPKVIPL